jgi:hypothetical protein
MCSISSTHGPVRPSPLPGRRPPRQPPPGGRPGAWRLLALMQLMRFCEKGRQAAGGGGLGSFSGRCSLGSAGKAVGGDRVAASRALSALLAFPKRAERAISPYREILSFLVGTSDTACRCEKCKGRMLRQKGSTLLENFRFPEDVGRDPSLEVTRFGDRGGDVCQDQLRGMEIVRPVEGRRDHGKGLKGLLRHASSSWDRWLIEPCEENSSGSQARPSEFRRHVHFHGFPIRHLPEPRDDALEENGHGWSMKEHILAAPCRGVKGQAYVARPPAAPPGLARRLALLETITFSAKGRPAAGGGLEKRVQLKVQWHHGYYPLPC